MSLAELLLLGVAVGANNLAVALALGALGQTFRRGRVMLVFGVFEFTLPLVGMWVGRGLAARLGLASNLPAAVLLVGLGLLAVASAFRSSDQSDKLARRVKSWGGLALLAAGLGLDNVLVGLGLGLGTVEPLVVAGTIASFSVAFTWLGMTLGRASRRQWETAAGVGAGLLLVMLGVLVVMGWF